MATTIFIILMFCVGVGGIIASRVFGSRIERSGQDSYRAEDLTFSRRIARIASAVAFVIMALVLLLSTVYSQDPGEAKVLRSFTGKVVGYDATPGLGVKAPWVSAITYDIRNQVVSYVGGGGEGQTGPAIPAQDKDGATATIDIVVRYSIDASRVVEIYNQYQTQDNFVTRLVQNDIRSIVRNIPLKYSTATFRLNRAQAALEMQTALAERWKNQGLVVDAVDLRDIRYPDNIEKSLQAVQEATNNANKAKADLETAKVNAEQTRVEAQAQADADQIVRCGARTLVAQEVINGVNTKVTKTIPVPISECQNRLNEQVLTKNYIDALEKIGEKGNLIVIPAGTTPILPMPTK